MRCTTGTALALTAAAQAWIGCAHGRLASTSASTEPQCEGHAKPAVVCGSQLEGNPARYLEELLEGRVAGVWLVRLPDGGVSLRVGGPTSIHGDNEPLYVLDGIPLQAAPGGGIDWLSPGDIERIEILKDPSATALYGMRGANGVVVITSRHGERRPPLK